MKCPHCDIEMKLGYLSAGGSPIAWTSRERRFSDKEKGDDVILQPPSLFGKNRVKTYICPTCYTLIADKPFES